MAGTRILAPLTAITLVSAVFWWRSPDRISTEEPEALFYRAVASLNAGRSEAVEAAVETLAEDRTYWRHLAVLDAVLFLRGGQPQQALQRLSPITEDNPVRELSLLYAGEALYTLKRLGEAQQVFQLLRSEFPENVDARRWLGAIYYDLGAYDAAIQEMQAVADEAPDDYRPYHLLGIMYQDFESYEEAARYFRLALDRNPPADRATLISTDLARVLVANRQYPEALQVLESQPESVATLELRATSCWSQGQEEEARQLLQRAEESGDLSPGGRQLKAELAEAAGELQESITILTQLLKEHPDRLAARYQLSLALQQSDMPDLAAEQRQQWEQQRDLANELIQLNLKAVSDPYDAEVRDKLADLSRQLGKTGLADMWQQAADACRRRNAVLETGPPLP
ncbi:MAG: tetratricopeptide repeat protein [Fuerstiella sp.]